jgi:hypothetical protein
MVYSLSKGHSGLTPLRRQYLYANIIGPTLSLQFITASKQRSKAN